LRETPENPLPQAGQVPSREQAMIDRLFCDTTAMLFDGRFAEPVRRATVQAGAFVLEFVFASDALAENYPQSLLHIEPRTPDLRIAVLGKSDVDLSELVPSPREQSRTYVTDASFVHWRVDRLPLLYVVDRRRRRGFIWLAADAAPEWELSRPACPVVHLLTTETSHVIAHGGAVSLHGHCLLLAGRGGAGKTTAALACARAGWQYAGDDFFFADTSSGEVLPLYSSARLRIDMEAAFADALSASRGRSQDDGDDRHELRLGRWLPPSQIAGGLITAILLPRRSGELRPRLTPATRTEAFNALFPTTRLLLPGPIGWVAEKLTRLVALSPAYHVDTGSTPELIPDAFAEFIARRQALDAV
jgi:hypothetical protein